MRPIFKQPHTYTEYKLYVRTCALFYFLSAGQNKYVSPTKSLKQERTNEQHNTSVEGDKSFVLCLFNTEELRNIYFSRDKQSKGSRALGLTHPRVQVVSCGNNIRTLRAPDGISY